jgi:hypothetical protein
MVAAIVAQFSSLSTKEQPHATRQRLSLVNVWLIATRLCSNLSCGWVQALVLRAHLNVPGHAFTPISIIHEPLA